MSDSGLPPTHEVIEEPEKSDEIPLWVLLGAIGVALVGGAVVAAVLLFGGDKDAEKKIDHPSAWDPRVLPFVKIVEKERGLTFLHPVEVRFQKPAEFEKVYADEEDLDAEDKAEVRRFEGLFRALGLIDGKVDLLDAFREAHSSGTLAYYNPEDEKIRIKGADLTVAVRATLVHELTHALQDQQFDIGDRREKFRQDSKKRKEMTAESGVLDGIVEGDAERVADLYRKSLPAAKQRELEKAETADQAAAAAKLTKIPKFILTVISAPYALGKELTDIVAADGGNRGVDQLFRDTPTHEVVLLDPFRALGTEPKARTASVPNATGDEKRFASGEFGALQWYFMLAERIPLKQALAAADGWGGDDYLAYETGGKACVRVEFAGRSTADTQRMDAALRAWVAAGSPAKITGRAAFESCDPGTATRVGKDVSTDALSLIASRGALGSQLLGLGLPARSAECLSGKVIQEFTIAQLSDPAFGSSGAPRARIQQLALSCR